MPNQYWKSIERKVAKFIGGRRVPVSGRQRGDVPDIEHAWLSVEVKYRAKMPFWLHDAMNQAKAAAKQRQLPCVILVERQQGIGESYIVFRLKDARDHWL